MLDAPALNIAVLAEPAVVASPPTHDVTLSHHGVMLDADDGPFLLAAEGDTSGARSVRQVVTLQLVSVP